MKTETPKRKPSCQQGFGEMAGEVLLLNFCVVTNGSASIKH